MQQSPQIHSSIFAIFKVHGQAAMNLYARESLTLISVSINHPVDFCYCINTHNDRDRKGPKWFHCVQKNSMYLLWKPQGGQGMHWPKQTGLAMQMQHEPGPDSLISNFLPFFSTPLSFFLFLQAISPIILHAGITSSTQVCLKPWRQ